MELEINGQKADLKNSIIAITRSVIDIDNLTLRKIDITNRFNLPKTSNNNQIFNSPYILNSNNNYLDRSYKAKLIDQFFLFNGKGFLTDINHDYKFQLAEQSKELFDELNQNLNQLNLESDDFIFSNTSYDSLKLPGASVWIWPIVNMHEQKIKSKTRFESGNAGLKFSRPCFNFSILLNRMFTDKGWDLNFDEQLLSFIAISANAEKFYVTSYQKTLNVTINGNIENLNTNDFQFNVATTNITINIGNKKTIFRLRGIVSVDNDVKITFKATDNDSPPNIVYKEFVVTPDISEIDFSTDVFETDQTSNLVEIITDNEITFVNTLLYTIIEECDLGDFNNNQLVGYKIKAYDNLPNKKQIDIFREALILTNSIIIPNSFDKIIDLKSLKNISKLGSVDWSEKFDEDSETITNELSEYAKKNYLSYDNDETVDSKSGRSFFQVYNENIKNETDLITFEYSASKDIEISGYTVSDWSIYNDTIRINELTDRIIYYYIDDTSQFTIGRFTELDWNQLKLNYYKNWFDSFYRLRIVEADFNLNKLDVLGFDFTNTIYVDKLKSHFFVLEIKNFVPNKKTRVKLLKFL